MRIEVVRGDITTQAVDAIVNAANSELRRGGGVCGAIHAAGGPEIEVACRALAPVPTGHAVATTAGHLPARWVIHAVGPIYDAHDDPAHLLASCHADSLRVADELGARSIAFPAISCGIYGYPAEEAAPIAVTTAHDAETTVELVRFVLFDEATYDAFAAAAASLA